MSLFFFAVATILFLGALAAGWVAGTEAVSPRKGRAKFFSYACVGMAFIALGIPLMMHQATGRTLPFAGTITSVQRTRDKSSRAAIQVRLHSGREIILHTGATSFSFHSGQRLQGEYSSADGTLLVAKILGKNGKPQSVFDGRPLFLLPYGVFLLGVFFVFAGWLLYRRDPMGANNARRRA